jgi:chromatin segregation and condensation protein Rec8/ScpA/Scc1 (kleisin family)
LEKEEHESKDRKWDYLVYELSEKARMEHMEMHLKALGREGWELVDTQHMSEKLFLYFKQPLKEPKKEVKVILHDFTSKAKTREENTPP